MISPTNAIAMQNEKTLQFWDDYYRCRHKENEGASSSPSTSIKEWILPPSDALVDQILQQLILDDDTECSFDVDWNDATAHLPLSATTLPCVCVLEIGCGTSLLSLELCAAWEQRAKMTLPTTEKESSSLTTTPPIQQPRRLHVLATDVSPVCIEKQQQQRQDKFQCGNHASSTTAMSGITLEYQVLNITERQQPLIAKFDLILDKGCLDTCLFRSKKADTWLDNVLINLHSWLKPKTGAYVIVTPRNKLKAVRDFCGFDVTRHVLRESHYGSGDLEPRSGSGSGSSSSTKAHQDDDNDNTVNTSAKTADESRQYMYVCRHKEYDDVTASALASLALPSDQINDNDNLESSNPPRGILELRQSVAIVTEAPSPDMLLPVDTERCPTCHVEFATFRIQQQQTRGGHRTNAHWKRLWNGHRQHCKQTP